MKKEGFTGVTLSIYARISHDDGWHQIKIIFYTASSRIRAEVRL